MPGNGKKPFQGNKGAPGIMLGGGSNASSAGPRPETPGGGQREGVEWTFKRPTHEQVKEFCLMSGGGYGGTANSGRSRKYTRVQAYVHTCMRAYARRAMRGGDEGSISMGAYPIPVRGSKNWHLALHMWF